MPDRKPPASTAGAPRAPAAADADATPRVRFETSHGDFTIELFDEDAPQTVANFLGYVDEGFFDGTIFHRVVPGFVIQGGGLTPDFHQKHTRAPVRNEAANGARNERGSLSMARTEEIHSATSQFFVNLADNEFLDHRAGSYGYAVFGRVTEGMDSIDRIAAVATGRRKGYTDAPLEDIVIRSARRLTPAPAADTPRAAGAADPSRSG